jgi:hypothetical protein
MDFARDGAPKSHWYYIAKHRAIKAMIGETRGLSLLEIGPSSGAYSRLMIEDGVADSAVCVSDGHAEEWMGRRRSDRIAYRREVKSVDADIVLAIDVIQDADDDVALLSDYARRARAGAQFVVSAPATNLPRPPIGGDGRTYTLEALKRVVESAGLEPVDARYFFGLIATPAALLGLASRALRGDRQASEETLATSPHWIHRALVALHDAEREVLFPVNRFAGASALCLARKPGALARKADAA